MNDPLAIRPVRHAGPIRKHAPPLLLAAGLIALAATAHQRWIFLDGFGPVQPHQIYRSAQPEPGDWAILDQTGPACVIRLVPPTEDPAAFAHERDRLEARSVPLVRLEFQTNVPDDALLAELLRAIAHSPRPVLIHCRHGQDRTGVVVAAWRVVHDGWPVRKAIAEIHRYRGMTTAAREAERRRWLQSLAADRDRWLSIIGQAETNPA